MKNKKKWIAGNVRYMGFPEGNQSYNFIWSGRTSYTYK
jgi:hypothetical protein